MTVFKFENVSDNRVAEVDAIFKKRDDRHFDSSHCYQARAMKYIEICKKIEDCDYEQFEEDGTEMDDVLETLAAGYKELYEAAKKVLELECDRVNVGSGEPYDPIVNPGQFDFRFTSLAKVLFES